MWFLPCKISGFSVMFLRCLALQSRILVLGSSSKKKKQRKEKTLKQTLECIQDGLARGTWGLARGTRWGRGLGQLRITQLRLGHQIGLARGQPAGSPRIAPGSPRGQVSLGKVPNRGEPIWAEITRGVRLAQDRLAQVRLPNGSQPGGSLQPGVT